MTAGLLTATEMIDSFGLAGGITRLEDCFKSAPVSMLSALALVVGSRTVPSVKLRLEMVGRRDLFVRPKMFSPGASDDVPFRRRLGLSELRGTSFELLVLKVLLRLLLVEEAMLAEEDFKGCSVLSMPVVVTSSRDRKLCSDFLKFSALGEGGTARGNDVDADGFTKRITGGMAASSMPLFSSVTFLYAP